MVPRPSSSQTETSVRHQPLKRTRGLSQFYSHKAQSFSCIQDLVSNPFSRSAVALAKRCSSWRQHPGFACVEEEMSDCESVQLPSPIACLQRRSWDLSDSTSSSSSSPHLSPAGSGAQPLQQQQAPLHLDLGAQQQQHQQCNSHFTAAELLSDMAEEAAQQQPVAASCWCDPGNTDSLCLALQTTSLATPLGLASYSMPRGFCLVSTSYLAVEDAY